MQVPADWGSGDRSMSCIWGGIPAMCPTAPRGARPSRTGTAGDSRPPSMAVCRSEEHTSELQSQSNLVCRLLLEKKKKNIQKDRKQTRLTTSSTTIPYAVSCLYNI